VVDCHGDDASTTDFEADFSDCVVTDFATSSTNSPPVVVRDVFRVTPYDPTLKVSSSSTHGHLYVQCMRMEKIVVHKYKLNFDTVVLSRTKINKQNPFGEIYYQTLLAAY